nr:uncharacterized protein LOC111998680 [Quercus suber]
MLHGEPLKDDASLRDFNEDEGAHVADVLERCLLLPADMAELDSMRSKQNQAKEQTRRLGEAEEQLGIARELIIDLLAKVATAEGAQREVEWAREEARRAKVEADFGREMALTAKEEVETAAYADGITQQVFVAEEWNRKTHVEAQAEAQARSEAERALDSLKGEISKLSEQLKGVSQERDSLDAGLKNAESQTESQRRQLSEAQKNLAAERETTKALHAELLKVKKAAEEAQKDAQLAKEATEAEKRASFQLGVETTEKDLTEQFAAVARDYCNLTWGKALDAAGVPLDSTLRLPENIFYGEDIRQHPDDVPSAQPPEASELPLIEPNPSAILEPNQGLPLPGDQVSSTEPPAKQG